MNEAKIMKVDLKGSYVNTTSALAFIVLVVGIIAMVIIALMSTAAGILENNVATLITILVISIFSFFFWMAVSKVLYHLLIMRSIQQQKLASEGIYIQEHNSGEQSSYLKD